MSSIESSREPSHRSKQQQIRVGDSNICPLCDSSARHAFSKYNIPILDCTDCGHRFAGVTVSHDHVDTIYGESYFNGGNAGYDNYLAQAELLTKHGSSYADIVSRYTDPGRMLDVGAAAGFILKGFCNAGWSGCGIEPNGSMADHARETVGVDVQVGTLENYAGNDNTFDLVTLIQVLPHFNDPKKALENLTRILKPVGHVLIETWNWKSLTAKCFGSRWHEYSPPSVLHWFNPAQLESLLDGFGMSRVDGGRPVKKIVGAHAKSLLRYKLKQSRFGSPLSKLLGIIPNRLVIPYPAEDLFWMVARKND